MAGAIINSKVRHNALEPEALNSMIFLKYLILIQQ